MALIYDLARFAESGMKAMQDAQRDWSPYLVHFASASSMQSIQMLFDEKQTEPMRIKQCLEHADALSFDIAKKIISSGFLRASSIQTKKSDPCVCLSECTLSGLIGHSERYGRFGFVFRKTDIFEMGGRPCGYIDDAEYSALQRMQCFDDAMKRLWGCANVYRPSKKIQDYTHEREWRVFENVPLWPKLAALLVPDGYAERIVNHLRFCKSDAFVPVMPIDMLYDWGA